MTTLSDVIEECRQHLFSGTREQINKLAVAVTDTTSDTLTLTLTYELKGITPSGTVSVGLETFHVWDVNSAAKTATVQRGFLGSTARTHLIGSLVRVNPKFTDHGIARAVNEELAALSSPRIGLWRSAYSDLTYNAALSAFPLPAGVITIDEVRYSLAPESRYYTRMAAGSYSVLRDADTAYFPSGSALQVNHSHAFAGTARVRYKAAFNPLVNLTDDVETVSGLHAQAHDLLSIGAAIRLISPREISRNFHETQGEPRRAEEVPPGAQTTALRPLLALRQTRIAEESARLLAQNPLHGF